MNTLKPMTAGELLDALSADIQSGKIIRDHKVVIYSANGRNAICQNAGITAAEQEYKGSATLIMAYAK